MKILPSSESTLIEAVAVLKAGGLVIYPTETMYGLGCDATNSEAVTKLLSVKERPAGKAVSVLVTDPSEVVEMNTQAQSVTETFLPGPVTVVAKDLGKVDPRLASEFGNLGFRISSHPIAAELVTRFGHPITATSANPAGKARPYDPNVFLQQFSPAQQELINLVIDAGVLPKSEPSTVIDTTGPVQEIVRGGAVSLAPAFFSATEETTKDYAKKLLKAYAHVLNEKALIFALEGDMGMGKTQFAKGLAEGLGVAVIVSSPTYSLVKEYEGTNDKFLHLDLWRAGEATPEEVGLPDYLKPNHVVVIEWSAPVHEYLKGLGEQAVVVRLQFVEDGDGRSIQEVSL